MKHIDEARLETDLAYRVSYVTEFMGFGPEDIAALHAARGPSVGQREQRQRHHVTGFGPGLTER